MTNLEETSQAHETVTASAAKVSTVGDFSYVYDTILDLPSFIS